MQAAHQKAVAAQPAWKGWSSSKSSWMQDNHINFLLQGLTWQHTEWIQSSSQAQICTTLTWTMRLTQCPSTTVALWATMPPTTSPTLTLPSRSGLLLCCLNTVFCKSCTLSDRKCDAITVHAVFA